MPTFTVVMKYGEATIEADEYRQSADGDLYFYDETYEDPVGMIPEEHYSAIFRPEFGSYEEYQ